MVCRGVRLASLRSLMVLNLARHAEEVVARNTTRPRERRTRPNRNFKESERKKEKERIE